MIAIGFDFDHTLAVDNRLERTALIDLAMELGVTIGANEVSRFAQIDTLLAEMREDRLTIEKMVKAFAGSLGADTEAPGLADRFREICYALVAQNVRPLAGARELFAELERRGVPYAVLSNGWSPLQEKKLAAIGFKGPALISGALGVAKPDKAAFDRLTAIFPAGAQIWYVGDNPIIDVRGALDAGLVAVWYHEHAGVPYPDHQPPPSATIGSLSEIPALLDAADSGERFQGRVSSTPKPHP